MPNRNPTFLSNSARILIVHPWLVHVRGGERTFFELARTFPAADLALLFQRGRQLPDDLRDRRLLTSPLQYHPIRDLNYRLLAPLMPLAASLIETSSYDVVLSSSSGWAHGVGAHGEQVRLCYLHTPARYLWTEDPLPLTPPRAARPIVAKTLEALRQWDLRTVERLAAIATNSEHVKRRIQQVYRRDADVIPPPVDVARMRCSSAERSFALVVNELVPYKRVDLAIEACRNLRVPLIVVGDGPERRKLESRARDCSPQVTFLGRVADAVVVDLMSRARVLIHAGIEDFGIATVEALASGTPVVGVSVGGSAEIVTQGCGELAAPDDVELLTEALKRAWRGNYDRPELQKRADSFSPETFRRRIRSWVENRVTRQFGARLGSA